MEVVVILALIVLNGVFAMAEIAVVSSNVIRLQQRAEAGSSGAQLALTLAKQPNRFLATVQIGITLVGVFAGAFGGATLAEPLSRELGRIAWLDPYSYSVAFFLVVVVITYLSLVVGELVPKRVALNNPEGVASALAPLMHAVSVAATPLVRFLSGSTGLVMKILRVQPPVEGEISEEELDIVIAEGRRAGVIEPAEHEIIENAFWLGERRVNDIMTPRHEVHWLDSQSDRDEVREAVEATPHRGYLVCENDLDDVQGYVTSTDILVQVLDRGEFRLQEHLRRPLIVPESMAILTLLERFKQTGVHFAVIVDEHGGVEGIATLSDILEELVGDVSPPAEGEADDVVEVEEGVWRVQGGVHVDRLLEVLSLEGEVDLSDQGYQTVGGLAADKLERVPEAGDSFIWRGYQATVLEMQGLRVERVEFQKATGGAASI